MPRSLTAFYTVEEEEPETINVDPRKYGGMTEVTHKDLEAFFIKQGATESEAKRWTGKLFEDRAPLYCAEGSRPSKGKSAFERRAVEEKEKECEYGFTGTVPLSPLSEGIPHRFSSEERWKKSRKHRAGPYDREHFHTFRSNTTPSYDYYQPGQRPKSHSSRSTRDYPQESASHCPPRYRSPVREPYIYTTPGRTKSSSSRHPRRHETYSTPETDYIDVDYDSEHARYSYPRWYRSSSPPRRHRSTREPPLERPSTRHESHRHRQKSDRDFPSGSKRNDSHREPFDRERHSSGHKSSSYRSSSNREYRSHEEFCRPIIRTVSPPPSPYFSTACDYEPLLYARG